MGDENISGKQQHKTRIHRILAYSYMVYLLALVFGLFLSANWPFKIFGSNLLINVSLIILLLSSVLILWAQKSSKKFNKESLTKESFMRGPYRFTRNPTNIGLFLAITFFGIIVNSFFVIFLTFVAFLFSRLVFIKKEESMLANKYGAPYLEYKKIVKF